MKTRIWFAISMILLWTACGGGSASSNPLAPPSSPMGQLTVFGLNTSSGSSTICNEAGCTTTYGDGVAKAIRLTAEDGTEKAGVMAQDLTQVTFQVVPGRYTLELPLMKGADGTFAPLHGWKKHFEIKNGDYRGYNSGYSKRPSSEWFILLDIDGLEAQEDAGYTTSSGLAITSTASIGGGQTITQVITPGSPLRAYGVFSSGQIPYDWNVDVRLWNCEPGSFNLSVAPGTWKTLKSRIKS